MTLASVCAEGLYENEFKSGFAKQLNEFVEQKKALGFSYNGTMGYLLRCRGISQSHQSGHYESLRLHRFRNET